MNFANELHKIQVSKQIANADIHLEEKKLVREFLYHVKLDSKSRAGRGLSKMEGYFSRLDGEVHFFDADKHKASEARYHVVLDSDSLECSSSDLLHGRDIDFIVLETKKALVDLGFKNIGVEVCYADWIEHKKEVRWFLGFKKEYHHDIVRKAKFFKFLYLHIEW